ncbi:MAG: ParB N-terminal domain-containing protein [Desulfobacterales bacterium]|nr:ParB N-terminal domain-containing protein [Desulfobacterales bacterium]
MGEYRELTIDQLVKADWNYKKDNDSLLAKLKENIRKNGQIENLVVRELGSGLYEIVNGNHRYDALVQLGIRSVYCYNLGCISKLVAKRIAVELNETRFQTSMDHFGSILKEISLEFGMEHLEQTLPFTAQDITNFIELSSFEWSDVTPIHPKKDTPTDNNVKDEAVEVVSETYVTCSMKQIVFEAHPYQKGVLTSQKPVIVLLGGVGSGKTKVGDG